MNLHLKGSENQAMMVLIQMIQLLKVIGQVLVGQQVPLIK